MRTHESRPRSNLARRHPSCGPRRPRGGRSRGRDDAAGRRRVGVRAPSLYKHVAEPRGAHPGRRRRGDDRSGAARFASAVATGDPRADLRSIARRTAPSSTPTRTATGCSSRMRRAGAPPDRGAVAEIGAPIVEATAGWSGRDARCRRRARSWRGRTVSRAWSSPGRSGSAATSMPPTRPESSSILAGSAESATPSSA